MESYFETNKSLWNQKISFHLKSEFYDVEGFKKGKTSLNPIELEALGDVKGKTLLHLQCHFGQDSLSWARMGAKVTGIDLSDQAIAAARSLNDELGLDARFIESNLYDIEQHLSEPFDIIFTTYGTIVWLPDLNEWARLISKYLKPGGVFCFVEFHPVINMLNWTTLEIEYPYFNLGPPHTEEMEGTYADPHADLRHREYFWGHSMAQTLQPLLSHGMKLLHFGEYDYNYYNFMPGVEKGEDGYWRLPGKGKYLPIMYSMKMIKE